MSDPVAAVAALLAPSGMGFGTPQHAGALTVVPVTHTGATVDYRLLSQVPAGSVRLEEVAGGGSVPELRVVNESPDPVLLVEGEMISGLKQTRTLNVTVLVPARSSITIPVSCVEQGRWDPTPSAADADPFHLSPKIRHAKTGGVQRHVRGGHGYRSEQGEVWAHVEERIGSHAAPSASRSYTDVHRHRGADIGRVIAGLTPERGQQGVLALIGERPVALDVFDRPDTLTALWRPLVGSYAADALVDGASAEERHVKEAIGWVHDLAEAPGDAHPAPGQGTVVQITGGRGLASALVVGDTVVHVAGLWRPGVQRRPPQRMQRPSRRGAWFHAGSGTGR
jgi:hypothetical protein